MMLVLALSTLAAADAGANGFSSSGAAPEPLRCEVRLPMHPQGWNTVLAECDGRPIAVGTLSVRATNFAEARITGTAQYADDMQQIYAVLSSPAATTPWWVLALAALVGTGGLTLLAASLSGPWLRWMRSTARNGLPPDAPMHP
jgi:hypothetical protein